MLSYRIMTNKRGSSDALLDVSDPTVWWLAVSGFALEHGCTQ